RWSALCCYCVDRILKLPPEVAGRPQIARYRRHWHRLAGLIAFLVTLTLAQTCSSGITFAYCLKHLGGCSAFLDRDPCLKTMVPFFVVSLIWLSIFCSCCCQSPKALSVFLLVGLCGEAILASYMVAFDRYIRIDDHLTEHLTVSLEARSGCRPVVGGSYSGDEVESRSDAAGCFQPFRNAAESCQRFDRGSLARCNSSGSGTKPSERYNRQKIAECIAEVLRGIESKKQLYQTATYSLLYLFASAHLLIALAVCIYDVRRKRAEKRLGTNCGIEDVDQHLLAKTAATEAAQKKPVLKRPSASAKINNNGSQTMDSELVLINPNATTPSGSTEVKLNYMAGRV
uniref:Tetraspanin n=1 Tax=Macrostomum lignano TaxID=282301 RepID=A0A1I8IRE7_9PLAT